MKIFVQLLAFVLLYVTQCQSGPASRNVGGKRVVCYFGSWAVYRYGYAKIGLDNLEPGLCSHFIYTFVGLDQSTASVVLLDAYNDIGDDWKKGTMTGVCEKARAAGTKCMVALGGWNEGSEKYSQVTCNPTTRAKLVSSIVKFVKQYKLDGFDLDWEYPGQRGGAPGDRDCFSALISDLRPVFDQNGWELSAAVSANAQSLPTSYNVADIAQKLDFINVMTYDMHGSWEPVTGHNAPLYGRPDEAQGSEHLNIVSAIQAWIDLGAPPSKLNLGLGTYGRSFTLANPQNYAIGAPSSPSAVAPSGWIGEAGFYGFMDICFNNGTLWKTEWDNIQKVPYAHSGNKWVGYDDVLSIKEKTCFARSVGLGGIMFWSVETDDFLGICNQGKYPLINAATSALTSSFCDSSEIPSTSSPAVPSTAAPESPTSEAPEWSAPEEPSTTSAPEWSAPQAPTTSAAPATEEPIITTVAPTSEVPTTTAPPAQTDAPILDNHVGNDGAPVQCSREGERIRDPNNCALFYTCISDGHRGFVAIPIVCPGGLNYDQKLQICNYRLLVSCA